MISGNQKVIRVFERAASKWEGIATRLHFDGNTISQIRTESQHNQLSACRNVFNEWLSGKEGLRTPRTWSTVIQALQEAHLGQLADELKDVLGGTYIIHKYISAWLLITMTLCVIVVSWVSARGCLNVTSYSRKIWRFGGLYYYNCQIKVRQNFLLAYIRMAILYRTVKIKSANILVIAIWGTTPKFNSANISGYTVRFWLDPIPKQGRRSRSGCSGYDVSNFGLIFVGMC